VRINANSVFFTLKIKQGQSKENGLAAGYQTRYSLNTAAKTTKNSRRENNPTGKKFSLETGPLQKAADG